MKKKNIQKRSSYTIRQIIIAAVTGYPFPLNNIEVIKLHRALTKSGLKESVDYVNKVKTELGHYKED